MSAGNSALVAAVEATWTALRKAEPSLPQITVALAAGNKPNAKVYGHFAPDRWVSDEGKTHELFIGGEALKDGADQLFATILHEAAHALAHAEGAKDTSRQGRYHNKTFRQYAERMGFATVELPDKKLGYSDGAATDAAQMKHGPRIAKLAAALSAHRVAEPGKDGRKSNNNGVVAECECAEPRKIRLSRKVYELGPIKCGICRAKFTTEEPDEEE